MGSKYIGFRCPEELYNEMLAKEENISKFIKSTIKSYQSKEFRDNLLNAYIQYSKLFHSIELHFRNNRSSLGINEFINFIQMSITNTEAIDKTEEIIK
jgi:hypothetical protein